ncbi:MAG: hypothetical protein IKG70_08685 [Lachnospiraceae bacterium]|nr:hypothetical protein [Lachnospiraceae bacterium]
MNKKIDTKTEAGASRIRRTPKNVHDPAAAAGVLRIARSYLENAKSLIYSYGSRTFLSGYDLHETEFGGRGNIDCSTFILLVLAGVPYDQSPYKKGTAKGLMLHPLADLDFSCFKEIPDKYTGIAERIGRPYLAGPKGLDLDKAKELGITIEMLKEEILQTGMIRRSVSLAIQFLKKDECFLNPDCRQPGDLVFFRSSEFFVDETSDFAKETDISHVGIISEGTSLMINSSGYLDRQRAQEENLPAVSLTPVFGRRKPAFFARPAYRQL